MSWRPDHSRPCSSGTNGSAYDTIAPLRVEQPHDVERRRLAHVVDVALVGDARDQDLRSVDRLALRIERLADLVDDVVRHAGVDVAGELDEARIEPGLLRLPRQIERIDRDAVAAEARARDRTP